MIYSQKGPNAFFGESVYVNLLQRVNGESKVSVRMCLSFAFAFDGIDVQRHVDSEHFRIHLRSVWMSLSGGPGEPWTTINGEEVSTMLCFFSVFCRKYV